MCEFEIEKVFVCLDLPLSQINKSQNFNDLDNYLMTKQLVSSEKVEEERKTPSQQEGTPVMNLLNEYQQLNQDENDILAESPQNVTQTSTQSQTSHGGVQKFKPEIKNYFDNNFQMQYQQMAMQFQNEMNYNGSSMIQNAKPGLYSLDSFIKSDRSQMCNIDRFME